MRVVGRLEPARRAGQRLVSERAAGGAALIAGTRRSKGQSFFIEGEPTTRRNQAGWMDGWMAHEGQEASKQTANVGSHLARRDGLGPLRDASRSVRPAAHERARKQEWEGRARKQAAGRADTA